MGTATCVVSSLPGSSSGLWWEWPNIPLHLYDHSPPSFFLLPLRQIIPLKLAHSCSASHQATSHKNCLGNFKMSTPLSLLITLSMVLLCFGEEAVEEVIKPQETQLLGGWFKISPDSSEVQEAALYAVKMYNSHSKGKRLFRLESIRTAHSQVTNMINFKIDAVLGKTKCLKVENHDLENCELEKKRVGCQFVMTFNPQKNKHELKNRTCKKLAKPKA
uniref:Cystatin domain-containing protein n=1 Tax=Knipowitschia caucasica TaxID=637954 RepID=A0AAV2J141_KNICA